MNNQVLTLEGDNLVQMLLLTKDRLINVSIVLFDKSVIIFIPHAHLPAMSSLWHQFLNTRTKLAFDL